MAQNITEAAERVMELQSEKFRIEMEIRDITHYITHNSNLMQEIALEHPECISVNWRKLANRGRLRR